MDYEKAYKKALEKAREELGSGCFDRGTVEYIFPELAESEDEKMKNWILDELRLSYQRAAGDRDRCEELLKALAWLERQGEQMSVLDELEMTLSVSEDAYLRSNLEKLIKEFKNDTGGKTELVEMLEVDGFDAELNALLKKYEHLSKKELQEPLEFYLGVVRDDLDVVREEGKPKWSEEDEKLLQHCCGAVAAADYYTLEDKEEMENWLKLLKQRMEEQQ